MLPNNFKKVNSKDNFYRIQIEKYGLTFEEACNVVLVLDNISDLFKMDKSEVINVVKELGYAPSDLFEYTTSNYSKNILLQKDAIYVEKINKTKGKTEKVFSDVYLASKQYFTYGKIIEKVFSKKYPLLYNNPIFITLTKRFSDDFEITPETKISKLTDVLMDDYNKLTCHDISELLKNKDYINSKINKSLFNFYHTDMFFLSLGHIISNGYKYDYSLTIPFKAFMDKDWEAIEKFNVFSIKTETGFFKGEQKDAPYFKNPLVQSFKELHFI